MLNLKSYITYLQRNRLFTFVNVLGLSLSLMFVLLLSTMVYSQLTVYHTLRDYDRLYVIENEKGIFSHYNEGKLFQSNLPYVEDWTAFDSPELYTKTYLKQEGVKYNLHPVLVRPNFLDLLGIPLMAGDVKEALSTKEKVIVSQDFVNKYLNGDVQSAVGKGIDMDIRDSILHFTISGVMDIRRLHFIDRTNLDIIMSFEQMPLYNWGGSEDCAEMNSWGTTVVFMKMKPAFTARHSDRTLVELLKKHTGIYNLNYLTKAEFVPLTDTYYKNYSYAGVVHYSPILIAAYLIASILILWMAVFNFTIINVAQVGNRAKEMAMKRLLGSGRRSVFNQILWENGCLTIVGFALGLLLAVLLSPIVSDLLGYRIQPSSFFQLPLLIGFSVLLIVVVLVSGVVPAWMLSHSDPLRIVKGAFRQRMKNRWLRSVYILQSGIATALLAVGFYTVSRMNTILHLPLGYSYGNVLVVDTQPGPLCQTFKEELKRISSVRKVGFSYELPCDRSENSLMTLFINGKEETVTLQPIYADTAFCSIFNIQIQKDKRIKGNKNDHAYFDADFFKDYRLSDTINRIITTDERFSSMDVDGTFTNFLSGKVTEPPTYKMLHVEDNRVGSYAVIEFADPVNREAIMAHVRNIYKEVFRIDGMNFEWYDQKMNSLYKEQLIMQHTLLLFMVAGLIISLLGIIALTLFYVRQRRHDMAIRKVFGSDTTIEMKGTLRFALTSLVWSLLISLPIYCIGIRKIDDWLNYHTASPWWMIFVAFVFLSVVSLLAVGSTTRRVIRENPINYLKSE